MQRWTVTDFEQNVNLRRSIIRQVTQHIEALDDVDRANVILTMPERATFSSEQKPATASISLTLKPNSSFDKKKIQGIQKLVMFAVEGLTENNIVITDSSGTVLNNFEEMQEFDRVKLIEKEQQLIAALESSYKEKVLVALQKIFTDDRVRDLNVKIDMDMSKMTAQSTVYSPITIKVDNPDTPYDDSEYRDYLPISSQTVTKEWTGTALMPEGPAGTEGQNPPVYSDMNNMLGTSKETGVTQNNVINTKTIQEERSPSTGRVSVSVNIDGTWSRKFDEKGNMIILANGTIDREYVPVDPVDLEKAASLVRDAVGYNRIRGDSITVQNIRFDRTFQFYNEDLAYIRAMETRRTIYMVLGGVAAVLLAFMLFRFISKERERRRRLKEEELLRKRQMERDKSLWEAEQGAMEVTMSVEERRRAELQETAIALAKEHPEDVAMLIRTWLMEE
jgi:flagellar M-ring protein FliF